MKKQITYYILIICLIGSLVTCKSSKISAPKPQQTSKVVENANSTIEAGNMEEQAIPADTTKNLKSLKQEKVYKNFVDSLENGITIEVMFGSYLQKADSVPQILKETFPNVYFYEGERDTGHGQHISYGAYYNGKFYDQFNYNSFISENIGLNKISKEQQIRVFWAFFFHDRNYKILEIKIIRQRIDNIDFDYLVNTSTPKGLLQLAFAFNSDGKLFKIIDITNGKNITFKTFDSVNQY